MNGAPSSSSVSLSGPRGYAQARNEPAKQIADIARSSLVEHRPYLPLLNVDPSDEASVIDVAKTVVSCSAAFAKGGYDADRTKGCEGKVTVITGGLTNALFKVDLTPTDASNSNDSTATRSVLVRVFGAEGMIDRDLETTHFARLCHQRGTVVHSGLDLVGRFGNGRVETWIPNMRQAHHVEDLGREGLSWEVARQMARLHYGYDGNAASDNESPIDNGEIRQPSLWGVIKSWIEELAGDLSRERIREDAWLMELFSKAVLPWRREEGPWTVAEIKASLAAELVWLRNTVEARFPDAPVVFCHNDVNAANIMLHASLDDESNNVSYDKENVCIIDYEYGAANYAMYDVANFMCEHCGGNDNGVPDFGRIPGAEWLEKFLRVYVEERGAILSESDGNEADASTAQVADLCAQAEIFQLASNLYWGIWGILQAAGEVADGTFKAEGAESRLAGESELDKWDNLRYGRNRLARYRECKVALINSG